VKDHPESYGRNRNGSVLGICFCACEAVHDYAAGAEEFLSRNTDHPVHDLHEWYVASRIGPPATTASPSTDSTGRSLDGYDLSRFNPNRHG